MIYDIYSLYYDKGEEKFYEDIIGKELDRNILQMDKLYDDFFNNLYVLSYLDKSNNFAFFKSLHNKETIAIGYYCSKQLEEKISHDPNLFIINNKPNLKVFQNICSTMNKAIDSFQIESNEFKNIYQLLDKKQNSLNNSKEDLNKNEINIKEIKEETTLKIDDNENNLETDNNDWWTLFF